MGLLGRVYIGPCLLTHAVLDMWAKVSGILRHLYRPLDNPHEDKIRAATSVHSLTSS